MEILYTNKMKITHVKLAAGAGRRDNIKVLSKEFESTYIIYAQTKCL